MSSDVKTTTFSPAETESVGDKLGYGKLVKDLYTAKNVSHGNII